MEQLSDVHQPLPLLACDFVSQVTAKCMKPMRIKVLTGQPPPSNLLSRSCLFRLS